jgi:Na+-transporting NADH:ubiquinone oxidoreductase subunit F
MACQVPVKQDMAIERPAEVFAPKQWECTVVSNKNVATFIKEVVFALPEGEELDFKAGGYIQITRPANTDIKFADYDIGEQYIEDWKHFKFFDMESHSKESVIRAYSMANYPGEKGLVKLNIRIETPRPGTGFPPGLGSSWLFSLKPGDKATLSGPYGHFYASKTNAEMVFIGGGAGMAPLRSIIFDQTKRLNSGRKISYWYGARSMKELFYNEDFLGLQKEFPNFTWNVAMSDPQPEDNWTGLTGFIHQVCYDAYLKNHDAPEDCEYYLCGPPMMLASVLKMLDSLGVPQENIFFDDFGS